VRKRGRYLRQTGSSALEGRIISALARHSSSSESRMSAHQLIVISPSIPSFPLRSMRTGRSQARRDRSSPLIPTRMRRGRSITRYIETVRARSII